MSFIYHFQENAFYTLMYDIIVDSPWRVYLPNVDPTLAAAVVTGLTPARTYQFRVCAVNQVGRGQYSSETNR